MPWPWRARNDPRMRVELRLRAPPRPAIPRPPRQHGAEGYSGRSSEWFAVIGLAWRSVTSSSATTPQSPCRRHSLAGGRTKTRQWASHRCCAAGEHVTACAVADLLGPSERIIRVLNHTIRTLSHTIRTLSHTIRTLSHIIIRTISHIIIRTLSVP